MPSVFAISINQMCTISLEFGGRVILFCQHFSPNFHITRIFQEHNFQLNKKEMAFFFFGEGDENPVMVLKIKKLVQ